MRSAGGEFSVSCGGRGFGEVAGVGRRVVSQIAPWGEARGRPRAFERQHLARAAPGEALRGSPVNKPRALQGQLPPEVAAGGAGCFTRMGQRGKAKLPALSSTTFTWQV